MSLPSPQPPSGRPTPFISHPHRLGVAQVSLPLCLAQAGVSGTLLLTASLWGFRKCCRSKGYDSTSWRCGKSDGPSSGLCFADRTERPTGAKGHAGPAELESAGQKLLGLQFLSQSLRFGAVQYVVLQLVTSTWKERVTVQHFQHNSSNNFFDPEDEVYFLPFSPQFLSLSPHLTLTPYLSFSSYFL